MICLNVDAVSFLWLGMSCMAATSTSIWETPGLSIFDPCYHGTYNMLRNEEHLLINLLGDPGLGPIYKYKRSMDC